MLWHIRLYFCNWLGCPCTCPYRYKLPDVKLTLAQPVLLLLTPHSTPSTSLIRLHGSTLMSVAMRRPYAEKYAADQDLFFKDYTQAHLKLSELGVEWEETPFTFDECLSCANGKQ